MSSGAKKTIQLNPDFFSLSGGKRKSRSKKTSRKKRDKPVNTSNTSKKMRKEFFSKIRALQEKKRKENTSVNEKKDINKEETGFNKAFNESLSFLSKYVEDKEEKKRKKRKKTRKKEAEQLQISLEMPDNLNKPAEETISESNNSNGSSKDEQPLQVITETPTLKVSVAKRPPYSSMKNGTLPTYREYKRQQTLKKSRSGHSHSHITIEDKPQPTNSERSKRLEKIKQAFKLNKDSDSKKPGKRLMKIKKSTRTIKRKLGKIDGKSVVSVLIKSRETRKNVQTEKIKLGQVSIIDIKKYLKDKNLIKAGSKAPNEVLRKMYEQAVLAGDINNKCDGVLLHNFVSNE